MFLSNNRHEHHVSFRKFEANLAFFGGQSYYTNICGFKTLYSNVCMAGYLNKTGLVLFGPFSFYLTN